MSTTTVYRTATEPMTCGNCREYTIAPGEDYIVDADGVVCGYECGCGDPANADGPTS